MSDTSEPSESYWGGILTFTVLKRHWKWYREGQRGEGRLVLQGQNLKGAAVSSLRGARLIGCDLSRAKLALMSDVELEDCTFDEAGMNHSAWHRAKITRCNFRRSWLGLADYDDATIQGGDWTGAYLERADWTRATVRNVTFREANLVDARFDDATFVDCDFRGANLGRVEFGGDLARCPGTRFERCDFRGANLDGLRLKGTTFDACLFHGALGKPAVEGPYTVTTPDFSAAGDGSDIRDGAEVYQMWGQP